VAQRPHSQRIGSAAQRFVELEIEKSGNWISRRQDEDFGIDLEAEIAEPSVSRQIIKVQIKSTESPDLASADSAFARANVRAPTASRTRSGLRLNGLSFLGEDGECAVTRRRYNFSGSRRSVSG
jgi:hypothetical protein